MHVALLKSELEYASKFCPSVLETTGNRDPARYIKYFGLFRVWSSCKNCPLPKCVLTGNVVCIGLSYSGPRTFSLIIFHNVTVVLLLFFFFFFFLLLLLLLHAHIHHLFSPHNGMTDPTSRQRGRPTETRQQISENNLRTESNIWTQVPEWARYLDILTDWSSVAMWFRLRHNHCKVVIFLLMMTLILHLIIITLLKNSVA
jgi:hypothetical protein